MTRMTDERLAEIENTEEIGLDDIPLIFDEILQAMKAERDDNAVLRRVNKNHLERISELERERNDLILLLHSRPISDEDMAAIKEALADD